MVQKVVVKYRSLRTNLIHLPLSIYAKLVQRQTRPQGLVVHLKLLSNPPGTSFARMPAPQTFLGWSGLAAASSLADVAHVSGGPAGVADTIELDPEVAMGLGWGEGAVLEIGMMHGVGKARSVSVTPVSADDWEVIEKHAGYLETHLLSQLRAAVTGSTFHIWVQGKTVVRIRVDETNPPTSENAPLLITHDTEVFVAPRVRAKTAPAKQDNEAVRNPSAKEAKETLPLPISSIKQITSAAVSAATAVSHLASGGSRANGQSDAPLRLDTASEMALRVAPAHIARKWPDVSHAIRTAGRDASANGSAPPVGWVSRGTYARTRALAEEKRKASESQRGEGGRAGLWVELRERSARAVVDAEAGPAAPAGGSGAEEQQSDGANGGAADRSRRRRVMLVPLRGVPEGHVVLGDPHEIRGDEGYRRVIARPCKAPSGFKSMPPPSALPNGDSQPSSLAVSRPATLAGADDLLLQAERYLVRWKLLSSGLYAHPSSSGGMAKPLLLCGTSGSGKTALAKEVAERAAMNRELLTETVYIDCRLARSETGQSISASKGLIQGWFDTAREKRPALLVLDGLDAVLRPDSEQGDPVHTQASAEAFISALKSSQSAGTLVIAIAEDAGSLHATLRSRHAFGLTITIPGLDSAKRQVILEMAIKQQYTDKLPAMQAKAEPLDVVRLSQQMEGFTPADLRDLIGIAIQRNLMASLSSSIYHALSASDFEAALADYRPRNLRETQLQQSETEWADIGGLHETKRVLRETLEWPTKYGPIFAKCPLRLRSGLLLYGYPGCGKTLLASAVAKECGLHFISVKGPELLNKYIGASEKSVRDIFARATAAKPCVLFFDEFDSIAPKRGHDSTGVTDRVVNQLLTEMDGAEGLDGVYVLAATSRPDLIDPALLRPGRLDKSLICDMPSYQDRFEILQATTRKVSLRDSVNLEGIARDTEGYSGADLQAIVYNAQLEAIHHSMEHAETSANTDTKPFASLDIRVFNGKTGAVAKMTQSEHGKLSEKVGTILEQDQVGSTVAEPGAIQRNKPSVTREDIETSFKSTRPSLPAAERSRLDRIYSSFVAERSGSLPNGEAANGVGARASLM